jgi:hypothetical protein
MFEEFCQMKGQGEELNGPAVSAVAEAQQHWSVSGWVTNKLLTRGPLYFGSHFELLVPAVFAVVSTNPHLARVVGYSPFSL